MTQENMNEYHVTYKYTHTHTHTYLKLQTREELDYNV